MKTSDWILDSLIIVYIVLMLIDVIKKSKVKALKTHVDTLQEIFARTVDADKKTAGKIMDTMAQFEKRITELEQKVTNDSRKI